MKRLLTRVPAQMLYYGILLQAAVAMSGSLFFSEVMLLPPCVLCWYQRIAMYPIVILTAIGILRNDRKMYISILGLSLPGLAIAIYHNLLYWKILPESVTPCKLGVSCTTKFFEWFGFITIPLMALVAFTVISLLAFILLKKDSYEKS